MCQRYPSLGVYHEHPLEELHGFSGQLLLFDVLNELLDGLGGGGLIKREGVEEHLVINNPQRPHVGLRGELFILELWGLGVMELRGHDRAPSDPLHLHRLAELEGGDDVPPLLDQDIPSLQVSVHNLLLLQCLNTPILTFNPSISCLSTLIAYFSSFTPFLLISSKRFPPSQCYRMAMVQFWLWRLSRILMTWGLSII